MKFWSYWKGTGGLKQNMKDIKQSNNPCQNR